MDRYKGQEEREREGTSKRMRDKWEQNCPEKTKLGQDATAEKEGTRKGYLKDKLARRSNGS